MPGSLDPVRTVVQDAMAQRHGVVITYQAATAEVSHAFLLYPKRIFKRGGYTYAEGWSIHRPTRILPMRATHDRGQHRQFRLDRILAIERYERPTRSLRGYAIGKITRRGVLPGVWGLFLDLLLVAFVVALVVKMIQWLL